MTFLDKYELLKKSIPVPAVSVGLDTEDCEFIDYTYHSKNCYFCFDSFYLENSLYCRACWGKNLVDCRLAVKSELCYQCIDCNNCYNSTYLLNCNESSDCHFSAFLNSCTDCFGCVGLSNKKYCILNNQLTKEQYEKQFLALKRNLVGKCNKKLRILTKYLR